MVARETVEMALTVGAGISAVGITAKFAHMLWKIYAPKAGDRMPPISENPKSKGS